MSKASSANRAIRQQFLAGFTAWFMQEMEQGRPIDEVSAEVGLDRDQALAIMLMAGFG